MNHGSWSANHVLTNIMYRRMSSKVKKVQNIFSTIIKPRSAWQVNTKRHLANHKNLTACFKYTSKYQVAFLVVTTQSTLDGTRPYTLYKPLRECQHHWTRCPLKSLVSFWFHLMLWINYWYTSPYCRIWAQTSEIWSFCKGQTNLRINIHNLSTLFSSKSKKKDFIWLKAILRYSVRIPPA